jgi:UDP-glucuronate 4-epimerase
MAGINMLITGGAGFIGSHLIDALLKEEKFEIYCIDNFDPFYAESVKRQNLAYALTHPAFHLYETDLSTTSHNELLKIFKGVSFQSIVHLAARAGVRPSIEHAKSYYDSNVLSTLNLLEFARHAKIQRFIFASSSSVYGNNPNVPWKETDLLHQPISPYGATKLAAEELGLVYARLYEMQLITLRLFTVYGPRQRPDLAIHRFYNLISKQRPITMYGDGQTMRDYTYVSDIVSGIQGAMNYKGTDNTIFNLGDSRQVSLIQLVQTLETAMQKKAIINRQPEQPGDVPQTYADISKAGSLLGYHPKVMLEEGIQRFVEWKQKEKRMGHAIQ